MNLPIIDIGGDQYMLDNEDIISRYKNSREFDNIFKNCVKSSEMNRLKRLVKEYFKMGRDESCMYEMDQGDLGFIINVFTNRRNAIHNYIREQMNVKETRYHIYLKGMDDVLSKLKLIKEKGKGKEKEREKEREREREKGKIINNPYTYIMEMVWYLANYNKNPYEIKSKWENILQQVENASISDLIQSMTYHDLDLNHIENIEIRIKQILNKLLITHYINNETNNETIIDLSRSKESIVIMKGIEPIIDSFRNTLYCNLEKHIHSYKHSIHKSELVHLISIFKSIHTNASKNQLYSADVSPELIQFISSQINYIYRNNLQDHVLPTIYLNMNSIDKYLIKIFINKNKEVNIPLFLYVDDQNSPIDTQILDLYTNEVVTIKYPICECIDQERLYTDTLLFMSLFILLNNQLS